MLHSPKTEMGQPPVDDSERAALMAETEMFPMGPLCGRALVENDRSCARRTLHEGDCLPASAAEEWAVQR